MLDTVVELKLRPIRGIDFDDLVKNWAFAIRLIDMTVVKQSKQNEISPRLRAILAEDIGSSIYSLWMKRSNQTESCSRG